MMNPKIVITVVLAVIAAGAGGALVATGIAAGALAIGTTSSSAFANNYVQSNASLSGSLDFHTHIITVEQGAPIISAIVPGGLSTAFSFGLGLTSGTNCGNAGNPAWVPGASDASSFGYWDLTLGGSSSFSVLVDGTGYSSNSMSVDVGGTTQSVQAVYIPASFSSIPSSLAYYCFDSLGGNAFSNNLYDFPSFIHTVQFVGDVPTSTVYVDFTSVGRDCHNTLLSSPNGGGSGTCQEAGSYNQDANCGPDLGCFWDSGGFNVTSWASATMYSSFSSFTPPEGQLVYNGGLLTIDVNQLGYAGAPGYTLELLCPQPRTSGSGGCNGGTVDQRFTEHGSSYPYCPGDTGGCVSLPNALAGGAVTFNVPAGASYNNSAYGGIWNTWIAILYSPLLAEQSTPIGIDIAPQYSPLEPSIQISNSGPYLYPLAGDTVTVQIWANDSSSSAVATKVYVWAFYLPLGYQAFQGPACGSQWLQQTNCPYGYAIPVQTTSSGVYSVFTFQWEPVIGTVNVGFEAQGSTTGGQVSPINAFLIQGGYYHCPPGDACNPLKSAVSLWKAFGPLLVTLVFASILGIAAIWAPLQYRVYLVIAAVGGGILIYVLTSYYVFGGGLTAWL